MAAFSSAGKGINQEWYRAPAGSGPQRASRGRAEAKPCPRLRRRHKQRQAVKFCLLMTENWKSYFANVNGKPSSIALDLALREHAPMPAKAWLLWVWIYLRDPGPNGMTSQAEFPTISAIEHELTQELGTRCQAIYAGRVTGERRRELYFYGADKKDFKRAVKNTMSGFRSYRYDFDAQHEPDWNQYFNVLFPSDEAMEKIKNQDVLEALMKRGEDLKAIRDVHHWIYFKTAEDRAWYASKVRELCTLCSRKLL